MGVGPKKVVSGWPDRKRSHHMKKNRKTQVHPPAGQVSKPALAVVTVKSFHCQAVHGASMVWVLLALVKVRGTRLVRRGTVLWAQQAVVRVRCTHCQVGMGLITWVLQVVVRARGIHLKIGYDPVITWIYRPELQVQHQLVQVVPRIPDQAIE